PEIPYDAVNLLKFPPNIHMGEGIGVATNSKGHVFVYTRSQETRLFEFDAKGAYIREIGEGLYGFAFAHMVRVDPQDNIWAFDKDGRFLKTVGTKGSGPGQLNLPHTIAADAKGNVYVGDRSNSRIRVFDNNLEFKAIYDKVGAPRAVCITPGPHQYLYNSNSNPDNNNAQIMAVTGEIYKMEL